MRTIRLFILGWSVCVLNIHAFAQEPASIDSEYVEQLGKFYHVSGAEKHFSTMIDRTMLTMYAESDTTITNRISNEFTEIWISKLMEITAPIYAKSLTLDDLKKVTVFYSSATGKKYAATNNAILVAVSHISQSWSMDMQRALRLTIDEILNERRAGFRDGELTGEMAFIP